jgi:hypothetical protein
VFWSTMLTPPGISALPFLQNQPGARLSISQMIVAYHQPCNLGNLLSPQGFQPPSGIATPNFPTRVDRLVIPCLSFTHSQHVWQCSNPNPNLTKILRWCRNPNPTSPLTASQLTHMHSTKKFF